MPPTHRPVVVAASVAAAQRLAQRSDEPADLGPARDPARAAQGWRRYGWPVAAPQAPPEGVLDRVRRLLALAERGGTEHEAAAAAAAAQRLIDRHRLDVALLDVDQEDEAAPPEAIGDVVLDDSMKRRVTWRGTLAGGCARAQGCRVYWSPVGGVYAIRIVGAPARVAAAASLYSYLVREVERLGTVEGAGHGRAWAHAWRHGCAARLRERLTEAARAAVEEARAGATGAELVRVERALARIDPGTEGSRVDAWMRAQLKLTPGRRASVSCSDGWNAGKRAGDRMGLGGSAALGAGVRGQLGGGR